MFKNQKIFTIFASLTNNDMFCTINSVSLSLLLLLEDLIFVIIQNIPIARKKVIITLRLNNFAIMKNISIKNLARYGIVGCSARL